MATARQNARIMTVGTRGAGILMRKPPFGWLTDTRTLRVWGAASPVYTCVDDFDRVVASGWGDPGWCLGAWQESVGATDKSVDGTSGVMNQKDAFDAYAWVYFATPFVPTETGRLQLRYRRSGTDLTDRGTDNVAFAWYLNWHNYEGGDTGSITGNSRDVMNIDDWRTDATGAVSHHDWSMLYDVPSMQSVSAAFEWRNFVLYVDRWGVYGRSWLDGEDEHAHDAPTQPSDYFTSGQGGWESWTVWSASDIPRTGSLVEIDRFGIVREGVWGGAGTAYIEIDSVSLSAELCLCGAGPGTTQTVYNSSFHEWPTTEEVAYWATDLHWTPDVSPRLFTPSSGGGPSGVTINATYTGPNTLLATATIGAVFFAWTGTASLRKNGTTVATQYLDVAATTDATISLEYGGEGTTIEVGDVFELVLPACPYSFVSTSFGVRYELYTNGDTP